MKTKFSAAKQDISEKIPNNVLVERFLWNGLPGSEREDAEGHWEQSCESLDDVVQVDFQPVKASVQEQQPGNGFGENLSLSPDIPTQPMTPERQCSHTRGMHGKGQIQTLN